MAFSTYRLKVATWVNLEQQSSLWTRVHVCASPALFIHCYVNANNSLPCTSIAPQRRCDIIVSIQAPTPYEAYAKVFVRGRAPGWCCRIWAIALCPSTRNAPAASRPFFVASCLYHCRGFRGVSGMVSPEGSKCFSVLMIAVSRPDADRKCSHRFMTAAHDAKCSAGNWGWSRLGAKLL